MAPRREVPSVTPAAGRGWPGPTGTRFGPIEWVAETGSTNADLLDRARRGVGRDGMVLVTDHQTAGRGRQGRVWQDRPAGSLLVSVLVRAEPSWAPLVPLATGLAAVEALADQGLDGVQLKWPNDVLVPAAGERKLAGILAEATSTDVGLWVVIGMGCNLAWPEDRPTELLDRLVTVGDLLPGVSREALLDRWLVHLDRRIGQLGSDGSGLVEQYRRFCLSVGREVRLSTPQGNVEGRVEGIADDGGLLVSVDGEVRRYDAGEVHHR
jgi:BirA family biotin operon repressor/biotin-[acetyl-CoA-carboxylase] ligase